MNWRDFAKLSEGEVTFVAGIVVGAMITLAVVGLVLFAGGLAIARSIVGG